MSVNLAACVDCVSDGPADLIKPGDLLLPILVSISWPFFIDFRRRRSALTLIDSDNVRSAPS